MTSDEIERLQLPDSNEARYLMLREIAFQLAKLNETLTVLAEIRFPDIFRPMP